uniref:Uncharacterized protein n=1 Tax=Panagrolaimus sp. JU765 TaxID=591449 RepID=A0AC34RGD3_9BILA
MVWLLNRRCAATWGYDSKKGGVFHSGEGACNYGVEIFESRTTKFGFNDSMTKFDNIFSQEMPRSFVESILNNNPTVFKIMDFLVENHKTQGYISNICFLRTKVAKEKPFHSLPDVSHFINEVYTGTQMFVIFDKKNAHLFNDDGTGQFLDKIWEGTTELTYEQKCVYCDVFKVGHKDGTRMHISDIVHGIRHDSSVHYIKYKLKQMPNKNVPTICEHDSRLRILSDQIIKIHWAKKRNESTADQMMKAKTDQCLEIFGGSNISECQLENQFPLGVQYDYKQLTS